MARLVVAAVAVAALMAAVPARAEDGKSLYDAKCAMCHGKDGVAKAMAKGSGNFNDPAWQEANSVDTIVKISTEGKEKMPKFDGKLTPEQIKMIAEYIKSMK